VWEWEHDHKLGRIKCITNYDSMMHHKDGGKTKQTPAPLSFNLRVFEKSCPSHEIEWWRQSTVKYLKRSTNLVGQSAKTMSNNNDDFLIISKYI
jgi:hypothetical protein